LRLPVIEFTVVPSEQTAKNIAGTSFLQSVNVLHTHTKWCGIWQCVAWQDDKYSTKKGLR
jgi:hypothetical protein